MLFFCFLNLNSCKIYNFNITDKWRETIKLNPWNYKLEVWGGEGAGSNNFNCNDCGAGGKGGYSVGYLNISTKTELYIYCGRQGYVMNSSSEYPNYGYSNGGHLCPSLRANKNYYIGGSSSFIVLGELTLIEAGGGGGAGSKGRNGGFGGGEIGGSAGGLDYGGTQNSSHKDGGGQQRYGGSIWIPGGSGGGGYYGGGAYKGSQCWESTRTSNIGSDTDDMQGHSYQELEEGYPGCGGSGYVLTKEKYESLDISNGVYLTDAATIGGNESIREPDGTYSVGHSGSGYARITPYEINNYIVYRYDDAYKDSTVFGFHEEKCLEIVEFEERIRGKVVTSIENEAFKDKECIKEVIFSPMIKAIGNDAFKNCKSLKNVIFSNVESIGNGCFEGCISLNRIEFSPNLESIGEYGFFNCNSLVEVVFFQAISIGKSCFENCTNLKYINIPPQIKRIGENSFRNCLNLKFIHLSAQISPIPSYSFASTGLEYVKISYSQTVMSNAFDNCANLQKVEFLDYSRIMSNAFSNCPNIKTIVFNDYVTMYEITFGELNSCKVYYNGQSDYCSEQTKKALQKICNNDNPIIVQKQYSADSYGGIKCIMESTNCSCSDSSNNSGPRPQILEKKNCSVDAIFYEFHSLARAHQVRH